MFEALGNNYLMTGLILAIPMFYLGKYIVEKHGFEIVNTGLDYYLLMKNGCNSEPTIQSVPPNRLIKIQKLQIRWQNRACLCFKKECFKIDQEIGHLDDYRFTLQSLGLELQSLKKEEPIEKQQVDQLDEDTSKAIEISSEKESKLKTRPLPPPLSTLKEIDDDHELAVNYLIDCSYLYLGRPYFVTFKADQEEILIKQFDLNPGQVFTQPVGFKTLKIVTETHETIDSKTLEKEVLYNLNMYMGPKGDFHADHTKLKLNDLYLPELDSLMVHKLILRTELNEVLEISNMTHIDIDDLF